MEMAMQIGFNKDYLTFKLTGNPKVFNHSIIIISICEADATELRSRAEADKYLTPGRQPLPFPHQRGRRAY